MSGVHGTGEEPVPCPCSPVRPCCGALPRSGRPRAGPARGGGPGDASLGDLATRDAWVDIAGSGDARIAPTGDVKVAIAGSGDVALTDRPSKLTTDISGSGDVYQD